MCCCIHYFCADIEGLARIGVACLQLLLSEAGPRFTPEIWDMVVASIVRLFDASTPLELLACRRYFLDYQQFSDSDDDSDNEVRTRRLVSFVSFTSGVVHVCLCKRRFLHYVVFLL